MKFLLLLKENPHRPHEADPGALNRAIRDHVAKLFANKTLDCAYYLLPKGGMCIINASSHEALLRELRSWPGSSQHDFEIHLLSDILQAIDENYPGAGKPATAAEPTKG
jgi:hypothetical protein